VVGRQKGETVAGPRRRGYDGIPAGWARRRGLVRQGLVVAGFLVVVAGLVLGARAGWLPEGGFLPLDLLVSLAGITLTVLLDVQLGRVSVTGDRLTVYTLGGPRTLALDSLRRVRLMEIPPRGGGRGSDLLFVRDGRGVRAVLTSADAVAAVAGAVTSRTRVSRHARRVLRPGPVTLRRGLAMIGWFFVPYLIVGVVWVALVAAADLLAYGR
jgi:hypothetical protein